MNKSSLAIYVVSTATYVRVSLKTFLFIIFFFLHGERSNIRCCNFWDGWLLAQIVIGYRFLILTNQSQFMTLPHELSQKSLDRRPLSFASSRGLWCGGNSLKKLHIERRWFILQWADLRNITTIHWTY